MRVLIVALGSAGDVHPFVALGEELRRRGHEVILVANGVFESLAASAGLGFASAGDEDFFLQMAANPDLWHPRRGPRLVFQSIGDHLRDLVDLLREQVEPGETLLVGSSLALGARLVQEADGIPLVTVHLQPAVLRSLHRLPRLSGVWMPDWAPASQKRLFWWIADRILDPLVMPALAAERRRLGLRPIRRPLDGWWHSPDRILGLFPDWFAPRQPDWPSQLRLTGFPLYDEAEHREPDPELDHWIDAGEAPLVFTAGSAHHHARDFFSTAIGICEILDRRGLLLSPASDNIPESLPEGVVRRSYAPFGGVLPRSAALVSHGGIGTVAQALAAGIPQLVVPFSHDQLDNASRLDDLGVGRAIQKRRFTPHRAARAVERILAQPFCTRASELSSQLRSSEAVRDSCDLLEDSAWKAGLVTL